MIHIGQDALGGWAWMIYDRHGALVSTGQDRTSRADAVEAAIADYEVTRAEADLADEIVVVLPDVA